jgi:serine/threonine-protein kinase
MRDLTMTGMLIGTPKYMAPEQILARDYDGRADLYALCVALYELSTGAPLFDEDSDYSLMKAHIDQVPVDPTKLAPLSAPFAACLLKGLEKKPDRRFQSANELAAALERAVRAPSPPPPAPARPKSRSNKLPAPPPPTAWPVVAAVAIALAALGALAAVGIRHALREPVVVVESPTPPPPAPELPPAAHVDAPPAPEPAPLPPSPPPAPSVKPKRVVPKTGKGELRITTTASGELSWAYVDIDGVRQGATPLVLKLEPGKHLLAITRQGLPDQTREVDIAAEAVEKLVVEMTP